MMTNRTMDLAEFARRPRSIALLQTADELFGILTRSIELPTGWAALVTRESGEQVFVPIGGTVLHQNVQDVLFVRTGPLDVSLLGDACDSSDGYRCDTDVQGQVALVEEAAELKAFRETVLGSRRSAELDVVQRHLSWPVQEAIREFAKTCTAEDLVTGREQEALQSSLEQKLKPVLFAAGLVQRSALRVAFTSEAFSQVRETRQREAKRRDQHEAREQVRQAVRQAQDAHLAHLGGLLGELETLADRSPDLSLGDLVRTFSERDRGQLYQALWQALPEQCVRWIVAASGEELLFFDPAEPERPVRRLRLPTDGGPPRSVTSATDEQGGQVLLIGTATGVHVLEPDADTPRATYLFGFPEANTFRTGVNAAALGAGRVFATHSEAGLVVWPAEQPKASVPMLAELTSDARTVRHAQIIDSRLWFAADDRVVAVPLDRIWANDAVVYTGSSARVTALSVTSEAAYAGLEDGRIVRWRLDEDNSETTECEGLRSASGQPVESAQVLATGGVQRLVYADESRALSVLVIGDAYTGCYEGGDQRVRRATIAGDWLVAMNDRRDRLLCWRPHEPDAPSTTIHVSRLTGRSIQDIGVVTRENHEPATA